MTLDRTSETVRIFDRVRLDGRRGTAVGFFVAQGQRVVLVRFDQTDVVEVLETALITLPR